MRKRLTTRLLSPRAPWLPLLLFLAVTLLAALGPLEGVDDAVTGVLPPQSSSLLRFVWPPVVFLFSAGIGFAIFVAVLLVLQRRHRPLAVTLLLAFVAGSFVELALKHWLGHPGPPGVGGLLHVKVPEAGMQRQLMGRLGMLGQGGLIRNSYPSGHALRALLLAVALVWTFPRQAVRVAAAVIAVVVPLVLVVARVHWPSDVIGGLLLGWALATLAALAAAAAHARARLRSQGQMPAAR